MSIEIIQSAIASLAKVCDHAFSEDGKGFNGRDAEFGHSLAEQIEAGRNLSPNQLNAAFKMLQTYRKQLQNMSIELPESFSATTAIATQPKTKKPEPSGKISLQGKAIIVTFPYSPETVAKVKSIKGAKWNPDGKFWQFPFSAAANLITSFSDFEVDPTIADEIKSAQSERLAELAIAQADYQKLVDAANVSAPLANGRNLYQHQKEAVLWSISQIQNTELRGAIMALDMGLGKAQKLDTDVLTPDGYVQMRDIHVGDWVIGSNGKPIKVFGVYPQGQKSIVKVTFTDDSSVECCEDHLWAVQTPCQKYRGQGYKVMATKEILRSGLTHSSGNFKYYIPMVDPIDFPKRTLPIAPYVLGVLLGDGTLAANSITWSKPNPQIAEFVSHLLPSELEVFSRGRDVYSIRKKNLGSDRNSVVAAIKELSLEGCRSQEKFIPDLFKYSCVEDRTALLQGLLDTDGSCSADGIVVEYGSTSLQLATDVQFLVESLGGTARMATREPWYTYQGERKDGQTFYRLNISLPSEIQPFKTNVKLDKYRPRTKYQPTRAIKSIEYVGDFDCQCIAVDAPDHLYVTEHCIVTHNTLCSLMVAKVYYQVFQIPVFVVCPASLKENWFREAEMVGVPIEVFSWAKMPKPLEISQYFLISDEAHYAQAGSKSARGKAFIELSTHENCKGSLALTGTPIKNGRPINLFPLLKAANHELAKNKRDFESYFCAAKPTRFCSWDVSGAAHLDELHARTKDVMFRRTKAQCLDLPEKTRMMRAAEVTGDALKTWKQSFLDAQIEYEQNQGMGKGEALVLLGKLRKAASVAKIETAIEMASDILEEGQQVVIFTEFLDTAKELHKRLGGELLIGETAVSDRQNLVDRFQSGQSKVFISTSRAGGVGITLTAAQTVIMVDRPWTSGDAMQCEDRCHRIGQKNSVSVYWLQWHEIDQKIDTILEQKQERIELILEGKRKTLRGIGSPADIAQELCEDILAKGKKK